MAPPQSGYSSTEICIELEFRNVGFWGEGKTGVPVEARRKTSWSREENQQQTQPTYCVETGNQSRDTSVGGEDSHHCAIPTVSSLLHVDSDALSYNLGLNEQKIKNNLGSPLYWLRYESDTFQIVRVRGREGGVEKISVPFNSVWDCRATQARFCFPASPPIY